MGDVWLAEVEVFRCPAARCLHGGSLPFPSEGGNHIPDGGGGQLLLSCCTAIAGCSEYPSICALLRLHVLPPVVVPLPLRVGACTVPVWGYMLGVEGG